MSRRKVRNWVPEAVEGSTIAPYRYGADFDDEFRWTYTGTDKFPNVAALKAAIPYKAGDVIYVEHTDYKQLDENGRGKPQPKRARIVDVMFEYQRRSGDRLELYIVQYETKAGIWAKVGTKAFPGYVDRGYRQAMKLGFVPCPGHVASDNDKTICAYCGTSSFDA
jgi:hypothetical protein